MGSSDDSMDNGFGIGDCLSFHNNRLILNFSIKTATAVTIPANRNSDSCRCFVTACLSHRIAFTSQFIYCTTMFPLSGKLPTPHGVTDPVIDADVELRFT